MSTTASASEESNSPRPGLGIDPEKAFDQLVFNDRTICSRCFRQIRRYDTYRPDADGGVSKYAPEERCVRAFDGAKGYKFESTDNVPDWADDSESLIPVEEFEYDYRPLHRPRTFCGECGSQSGRADDLVLSRSNALLFADNLIERFNEANVALDERALKYLVQELKSREKLCGYDTEIFRRATKVAIKQARYNHD